MITKISNFKNINEAKARYRNTESRKSEAKGLFAVDEPTDDDAIKEDGLLPFKQTLNTDWIEAKLIAKKPFFIIGHAGWGKTSIIKQVAKSHGLTVITVYLDKAQPEDLGGLPIPKTKEDGRVSVTYALPSWAEYIYDRPEDDFLVFFDEMNQASPDVQNALMPILLESVVGGIKFDNIWFGAAGNFSEENASISDLSAPLRSRFVKEKIWNEQWEDAFEYIIDKYTGKLPETLLDTIIKNNITVNPRELAFMLDVIIDLKKSNRKFNSESIIHILNDYNQTDKTAETKKIAQEVYKYLTTDEKDENKKTTKTTSKPKVDRPILNSNTISQYANMVKKGGFITNTGDYIELKDDWEKTLNLTPEEAALVKKAIK